LTQTPLASVVVRSMARLALADALAALGAQDHPNLEIVVVAASGPGHPDVPPFAGPHPVRLIRESAPMPRARAANAGLDAAQGDWITFLDDDDACDPDHVSGLVREAVRAAAATRAEVVYSFARAVFRDGSQRRFGQPYSLMQLYERNYISLSTALVARAAVAQGCRFDEAFDVHEDWDFFLQLAQRRPLHFVPRQTFVWHADMGSSGAGGGANQDDARFAAFRDRIYAKWGPHRDALLERTEPLLQEAAAQAQRGARNAARTACGQVLALSPNDPFALNLLAMIERADNDLASSRRVQELAVAVRPQDPDFAYNLALVCRDTGDRTAAYAHAARALALDPKYEPARALLAALAVPPPVATPATPAPSAPSV
jgi:tetratricopeptide (TPR) repeat protein